MKCPISLFALVAFVGVSFATEHNNFVPPQAPPCQSVGKIAEQPKGKLPKPWPDTQEFDSNSRGSGEATGRDSGPSEESDKSFVSHVESAPMPMPKEEVKPVAATPTASMWSTALGASWEYNGRTYYTVADLEAAIKGSTCTGSSCSLPMQNVPATINQQGQLIQFSSPVYWGVGSSCSVDICPNSRRGR